MMRNDLIHGTPIQRIDQWTSSDNRLQRTGSMIRIQFFFSFFFPVYSKSEYTLELVSMSDRLHDNF